LPNVGHQTGEIIMHIRACASLLLVGLLCGCVANPGRTYSRFDTQVPWTVDEARVLEVKEASIEGNSSELGLLGGGLVGGTAGATIGNGTGAGVAAAVGAVAGALAGVSIEKAATTQRAWEIMLAVENSKETLMIVQLAEQSFEPGEKVKLFRRSDGAARVSKL
jgi:outer membrane lipoprotein SlyB